jgi:hypothetical protein
VSMETAIWKMTPDGPEPLAYSRLDLESRLEDMLVADPSLVGLDLLVVGRQVTTAYGGFVDVLGVDSDGQVHVVELKRDRTPRDVVAQTLDYGAWAAQLTLDDVITLFAEHRGGTSFEDAFAERFATPLPDVFNADQRLTIVASQLDPASDRIVEYLAERFQVPVNAVFFRHFTDGEHSFLTRTWLLPPEDASTPSRAKRQRTQRRPWNGRDFYVIQGSGASGHATRWSIARRYGMLTAGGGSWYWKTLRNLSPGKRVFVYVGQVGYVGVGVVTGELAPVRDVEVEARGERIPLHLVPEADETFTDRATSLDEEVTEMAVPVRWIRTLPVEEAISVPGLFASQVTACKLRDDRTIEVLEDRFELAGEE